MLGYGLVRPLLFRLEAETAHHLTLETLQKLNALGLVPAARTPPGCERNVVHCAAPIDSFCSTI